MTFRECEVILDVTSDYDGSEIEVTCGRLAVAKLHDWWMCEECREDALRVERQRRPPARTQITTTSAPMQKSAPTSNSAPMHDSASTSEMTSAPPATRRVRGAA